MRKQAISCQIILMRLPYYSVNTQLEFSYFFIKDGDTLLCAVKDSVPKINSDFSLVPKGLKINNLITHLKGKVLDKIIIAGQTALEIKYMGKEHTTLFTTFPGIIENEHNHWWHPPRMYYFYVTEFSPFPFIKYPLKKGLTWKQKIFVFPSKDNERWIPKFDGMLTVESTYQILKKDKINTAIGHLNCYVTKAESVTPYGKGYLTSYFHEEYGFVRLEYQNIDNSKLVIELESFLK